jgi:hypothetical protein
MFSGTYRPTAVASVEKVRAWLITLKSPRSRRSWGDKPWGTSLPHQTWKHEIMYHCETMGCIKVKHCGWPATSKMAPRRALPHVHCLCLLMTLPICSLNYYLPATVPSSSLELPRVPPAQNVAKMPWFFGTLADEVAEVSARHLS